MTDLVGCYHNSKDVWVLLRSDSGFERTVPPNSSVPLPNTIGNEIEVIPLSSRNAVFSIESSNTVRIPSSNDEIEQKYEDEAYTNCQRRIQRKAEGVLLV